MQKNSVVKNYVYNLLYQILVIILPLITTPYISRVLGAENVGIYGYTISIVTYFTLFGSLGIALYVRREIAYLQDDIEKRSKVFWEFIFLRAITLSVAALIFYFVFARSGEYSFYYKILLFHIFAAVFDITAFFQGLEQFKKIIRRNLIIKIISVSCVFIFIHSPKDLYKYLLIYTLSDLIGNLSLWIDLPKYITGISFGKLNLFKHIKPTVILFIPQIATQIYTVLDKTMIGSLIADKAEVGYYEQSQKIVLTILTVVTSLGTVMLPRMANKFANGRTDEVKNSITASFRFIFFLAIPMVFGMISVSPDLIIWFLGKGYARSIAITQVISPIILFIGLSNVIGVQYLLPTMKQKQYTISVVSGALTNLVLNFILIPRFMSVGAALATVAAEATVAAVQLFCIRKEFDIPRIFLMSIKNFISAMLMSAVIFVVNRYLFAELGSMALRMVFDILIGGIVYIASLAILRDSFFYKLIGKIFGKLKM